LRVFLLGLVVSVVLSAAAFARDESITCTRTAFDDAKQEAPRRERKYAPDRLADILHLKLDVTPDFRSRTVSGTATVTFRPIALPLHELRLDAVDLTVLSVESSEAMQAHQTTEDAIVITFQSPIQPGAEANVSVHYEAEPEDGLFFITPELGYPPEDEHCWTQGEPHSARHWYPSYDYPNERFTSEIICHVPKEMVVLSNGRKLSEEADPTTGQKAVHWLQDKPHVNYLVALVAGRFEKLTADFRGIPLGFYTPPSQFREAPNSFEGTEGMMAFFEEEIGVAYPWDQYNQVVVYEHGGGMENTTLTTLTEHTLFRKETENVRSSRWLVAHELAHMWFGDYVTCKDWSHTWLNEGFATYYEALHAGHVLGPDHLLYEMYRNARKVTGNSDSTPIVYREYGSVWQQFNYRAYPKGAWVLHMLRCQLGEDLFRRCVKAYVERYALTSVVTEDLNRVFESLSGRSLDRFFDQWVYHGRHPELEVSYSWDERSCLAKLSVKQTQKLTDEVLLFHFPVKLQLRGEGWTVDRAVEVSRADQDFYVSLPDQPRIVRFDRDYSVLATVKFDKPVKMLYAQLADTTDVIGQILAARALKSRKDKKTVARLRDALNSAPFYGVRVQASRALADIRSPEAFEALAASHHQSDARVRLRVAKDIGKYYRPKARQAALRILETEKNPTVVAAAIRSLGKYPGAATREILLEYLESQSYRNELAGAAVQAVRTLDDPAYAPALRKAIRRRERMLTHRDLGSRLDALAYISRNEDDRTMAREFLVEHANHRNKRVQRSAIAALGTLGDPRAIPVVTAFTGSGVRKTRVQKAADAALKKLRAARKVSVELKDLRDEVTKLKQKGERLQEDLEDLKKRLDAKEESEEPEGAPGG